LAQIDSGFVGGGLGSVGAVEGNGDRRALTTRDTHQDRGAREAYRRRTVLPEYEVEAEQLRILMSKATAVIRRGKAATSNYGGLLEQSPS
jgi:hypothetical protein